MNGGASLRCFIALGIPDDIRWYLCSIIARLQTSGADVKWVGPDNIHLTLKFLGACSPEQVEAVTTQLSGLKGSYRRIEAALDRIGVFPDHNRPQVIWAGLALQDQTVRQLQQEIEQRMGSAGFPRETKPFKPHLTLGRMRSLRKADALTGMMQREPLERRGFVINSVSLMKSDLRPAGPFYQPLLTIGLE